MQEITSLIRLRISAHEAHYAGGLVDGARMLHLFGDVATELLIRSDGDEGLFVAYDRIEFLAPVYAGDYIEASALLNDLLRAGVQVVSFVERADSLETMFEKVGDGA